MEEKCADLMRACEQNADCACMAECTGENGIPGITDCFDTCGVTERPPGFAALEVCVATACPDTGDECSTPSDYTPPADMVCEDSTLDIGGGSLADCGFDTGLAFDPDGAVLQLESADQNVCVRLQRRNDGAGSLANTEWTLLEIQVGPLGEVALVDDSADLCWYSSHHNFRDLAHAWTGTRHFDLMLREDGHGGERVYELYVFEEGPVDPDACSASLEDSLCIEGPIELFPVNP